MKKIKNFVVFSTVFVLTVLACTKEIDIIYSFAFALETNAEDTAVINYQERTTVTIKPERIVADNVYEFSYTTIQGTGYFENLEREALSENTWYASDGLIINLEFIGTELGDVEMELIVKDKEGIEETTNLLFTVIHNPFVWEVNSSETDVAINIASPFTMTLDNIGRDQSVTYESRIYFTQGDGELFIIDSGNEILIPLDNVQAIEEKIHSANAVLSELGTNTIIFEVTDSNGQVIEDTLVYETDIIDFTFEGTPQSYTIFVDDKINIEFLIQEILGGNDTYQSSFQFNSGNAALTRITNGIDEDLIPGSLYSVNLGSYYWEFEGADPGTIDMTFFAQNISGVEHEVNIIIEVINGTFDFTAVETENVASVNDAVSINLNINEIGNAGFPYEIQFNSILDGEVNYNGVDYSAGDVFIINQANAVVTYTGLESGSHTITFSATNSFGETKEDDAVIIFNEDDFAFSAEAENGNVFLNGTTRFNFNILDNNDTSTYQIYYTVSGTGTGILSSGGLTYLPDVRYSIIDSGTTWEFEGTGLGDITYTFYAINNSGKEKSKVVNISVLSEPEPDFNFTAVAETNIEYINEKVYINFSIDETIRPNIATYSMVFTTTGTGIMTYLGSTYNAGETIIVSPENFVLVYEGLSSGIHDIEFTVSNNNTVPISKTNTVSITFENIDFDVDASPDNTTTMFVSETENFNVLLTQDNLDPSITYTVVYSITGSGSGIIKNSDGFPITPGQSYPTAIGNTELRFEAETSGDIFIEVTITDSNGISHSDTVLYQINDIDFNLAVSGGANIFVNQTEGFNVILSQEQLDPSITYSVVYSITGSGFGTIETSGGGIITLGQSYPISVGNTEMRFIADTMGDVLIDVTVIDSNGVSHTDTVTYQINDNDFSLVTSGDATMFVNETEGFNVLLSQEQLDPSIIYSVVYSITGSGSGIIQTSGGGIITLGQSYPISVGNTEMRFIADTEGDVIIDVSVIDSSGISHNDTVLYQVNDIDFNLVTSGDATLYVNETEGFNVLLSQEQLDASITYSVVYSITGSGFGTIETSGGGIITLGQSYPISIGNTEMRFTADTMGDVIIDVAVIDSNGISHNDTVLYQINDIDFNLVTSGDTTMFVNETGDFNVFLSQEQLDPSITYSVVYSITGSGFGTIETSGGGIITLDQPYPISIGNTEMRFIADTMGDAVIGVTVTDSNGVVHIDTVTYQINNIDFSLSTSTPADTSMFANEKENFNVFLTQDQIDPLINYTVIYTFSSGSVTRKSDNFSFVSGTSYPISPGNIEMVFESEAIYGDVVIGVEVTDSNGVSHNDTITFQVNDIEYFFTSIDSPSTNTLVNEEISLNFNISETIPSSANYSMKYEVTSTIGEVITEGVSARVDGSWYNVNTGSFAWNFKAPAAPGVVEITFTVINSITLEEQQIVITVTVT